MPNNPLECRIRSFPHTKNYPFCLSLSTEQNWNQKINTKILKPLFLATYCWKISTISILSIRSYFLSFFVATFDLFLRSFQVWLRFKFVLKTSLSHFTCFYRWKLTLLCVCFTLGSGKSQGKKLVFYLDKME